jgi:signal transduction histidine kinase
MTAGGDYQPALSRWGHAWRTVLVVVISIGAMAERLDADERARLVLDLLIGAVALGAVFLRRRHPLAIAVLAAAMTAVSATATGPSALATTSLATRRAPWQIAAVAVVHLASSLVLRTISPVSGEGWIDAILSSVILLVALVGWGLYVGSRRELLWNLRQRVVQAEAERDRRAAEARAGERTRIAREMHDVVAHHISQVSMRAGALAFREDLGIDQMRAESTVIHDAANEALRELRSVLHVLRDPATGDLVEAPQPTYGDIAALVERARAEGMRIDLTDEITQPPSVDTGRTMYRVVQEGMTNAAKHAPGARLRVVLASERNGRGDGVAVTMTNAVGFKTAATPGAGLGLVGIAERVAVARGELTTTNSGTEFSLRAWLPCQP